MARASLPIPDEFVSTLFEAPPGHEVAAVRGVARGVVVRCRNLFFAVAGVLRACCGGNIGIFQTLCEETRRKAFDLMVADAARLGGHAVLGMRYDATDLGGGITEVIAYGGWVGGGRSVGGWWPRWRAAPCAVWRPWLPGRHGHRHRLDAQAIQYARVLSLRPTGGGAGTAVTLKRAAGAGGA